MYHVLTVNITKYERAGTRTHATQTICVAEEWAVDDYSGHVWIVVVKRNKRIFGGKVEKAKRRGRAKKGGARKSGKKRRNTNPFPKQHTQKTKGTTHFG